MSLLMLAACPVVVLMQHASTTVSISVVYRIVDTGRLRTVQCQICLSSWQKLGLSACSDHQVAYTAIESKEGRAKRFVELWTLKEAYVKAVGQGISAAPGLKGFSVLLQPDAGLADRVQQMTAAPIADAAYSISFHSDVETEDTWGFMLLGLSSEHTAALCLQTSSLPQIARQNSAGSNASTDTIFDSLASRSMPKASGNRRTQLGQIPVKFTFRGTVPLVTDDQKLMCCVKAVGGL